ncbi:protein of unknown function DUF124 [Candidatus Magnetoovum chiemensis]|nr:protein of unknown function DUF124 [Candidatus Magnetoovum chiemensis]
MKLLVPSSKLAELTEKNNRYNLLRQKSKEKDFIDSLDMHLPQNDIDSLFETVQKRHEDKSSERLWDIESNKQLLTIDIQHDSAKTIFAEGGRMVYMGGDITTKSKDAKTGNFLLDFLFTQKITYYSGQGTVGFSGDVPGEIALLKLEQGDVVYSQKNAFVAGIGDINYSIEIAKSPLRSQMLGEGLLLMRLSNENDNSECLVFFHAIGGWTILDLKEGKILKVEAGSVVAWENSVTHEIVYEGVKSGISGQGAFMNKLTGPGKVIIQPLALEKLQLNIGETICFGPPPVILWQLLQRKFKKILFGFMRG